MMPSPHCPICGPIGKDDISLYNETLRKQTFELTPIYPACLRCGAAVTVRPYRHNGKIIVLSGTCGSGKSTVAIELMKHHGYTAIDTDCVMQTFRHKHQVKQVDYRCDAMLAEIAAEIDAVGLFNNKIVLAQVVLREDIVRYQQIFNERHLTSRFYLLKPSYEKAYERCQTRTCHTSITPEYWIKYFYELLDFTEDITVIDNSKQTPEETAAFIAAGR